jgi:transcriptional regulator with XRE-family HTH domain
MAEKTVSDQLRKAISSSPMSLRDIAEQCSTSHSQLSRFLNGDREIGDRTFSRLCKYLRLELRAREENLQPKSTK